MAFQQGASGFMSRSGSSHQSRKLSASPPAYNKQRGKGSSADDAFVAHMAKIKRHQEREKSQKKQPRTMG